VRTPKKILPTRCNIVCYVSSRKNVFIAYNRLSDFKLGRTHTFQQTDSISRKRCQNIVCYIVWWRKNVSIACNRLLDFKLEQTHTFQHTDSISRKRCNIANYNIVCYIVWWRKSVSITYNRLLDFKLEQTHPFQHNICYDSTKL
jgi:hypothetical protein